jgi:hypothetical protein
MSKMVTSLQLLAVVVPASSHCVGTLGAKSITHEAVSFPSHRETAALTAGRHFTCADVALTAATKLDDLVAQGTIARVAKVTLEWVILKRQRQPLCICGGGHFGDPSEAAARAASAFSHQLRKSAQHGSPVCMYRSIREIKLYTALPQLLHSKPSGTSLAI